MCWDSLRLGRPGLAVSYYPRVQRGGACDALTGQPQGLRARRFRPRQYRCWTHSHPIPPPPLAELPITPPPPHPQVLADSWGGVASGSLVVAPPPPPTRSVHLDAPSQWHGQQPVSRTADPGAVKQDKSSRGSVDTTKTCSDPQRVRMSSGERRIGTAKGKQPNTEALVNPPPPPPPPGRPSLGDCLPPPPPPRRPSRANGGDCKGGGGYGTPLAAALPFVPMRGSVDCGGSFAIVK